MKTRIQLTARVGGKYQSKASLGLLALDTNWIINNISGDTVLNAISPIAAELRRRHEVAVAAGRALKRGGVSVRIQITEYAKETGEYAKCEKGAGRRRAFNESCPGANLETVSNLVAYILAAKFGVKNQNLVGLQKKYLEWTEGGLQESFAGDAVEDPQGGIDTNTGFSSNTVQILEPIEPTLCGIQWDIEKHRGFWAIATGDMLIVRSLHRRLEDAIPAFKAVPESTCVDPDGYIVDLLSAVSTTDACEVAWDTAGSVAYLMGSIGRTLLEQADRVLEGKSEVSGLKEVIDGLLYEDLDPADKTAVLMAEVFLGMSSVDDVKEQAIVAEEATTTAAVSDDGLMVPIESVEEDIIILQLAKEEVKEKGYLSQESLLALVPNAFSGEELNERAIPKDLLELFRPNLMDR